MIEQKQGQSSPHISIVGVSKQGSSWKVIIRGTEEVMVDIDANSGKINYFDSGDVKINIDKMLQSLNS